MILALATALSLTVTDGDTLRRGDERIRLMGVDAPETLRPKCLAEKMLGVQATRFVRQRVAAAHRVRIERHGLDRYHRTLARVWLDGEDLSQAVIDAGLGVPYSGGRRGWKWC